MVIEEVIEIEAPVDQVWSVMSDVERWHEWTASIKSVKLLDSSGLVPGGRARIRQPGFPAAIWRVVTIVPGRKFVWESVGPGLRSIGIHTVEPLANGRSRAILRLENHGPLSFLFMPFAAKSRYFVGLEARGLKQRSEQAVAV